MRSTILSFLDEVQERFRDLHHKHTVSEKSQGPDGRYRPSWANHPQDLAPSYRSDSRVHLYDRRIRSLSSLLNFLELDDSTFEQQVRDGGANTELLN